MDSISFVVACLQNADVLQILTHSVSAVWCLVYIGSAWIVILPGILKWVFYCDLSWVVYSCIAVSLSFPCRSNSILYHSEWLQVDHVIYCVW
jgi:hypothetical protein